MHKAHKGNSLWGYDCLVQPNRRIGLARALSKLGYCSRSQAFTLIRAGRVRLNGAVKRDPEAPVDLEGARIEVNGAPLAAAEKVYLVVNKPRGIVTTTSDEKGRATVYSLLPRDLPWVAPVGRLDKASEGLLLLTNDSEWAARISAPESHLEKTYHVQIARAVDSSLDHLLHSLQRGVREQGELLRIKRGTLLRAGEKNCWLEIVLEEGRNRHIRRMLDALGIEVLRLVRVSIGPLALGDLPKGAARALTPAEKSALDTVLRATIHS
jgi:23S rRNA pseudouridine2605 synthase